MGSIETGQGRVPAPASSPRVPAGVRAGGQFRTAERAEAPVALAPAGAVAASVLVAEPRAEIGYVPDGAAALPAFDDGVVWDG